RARNRLCQACRIRSFAITPSLRCGGAQEPQAWPRTAFILALRACAGAAEIRASVRARRLPIVSAYRRAPACCDWLPASPVVRAKAQAQALAAPHHASWRVRYTIVMEIQALAGTRAIAREVAPMNRRGGIRLSTMEMILIATLIGSLL